MTFIDEMFLLIDFMKQKKRRRVSYSSGAEKNCETKSLNDTRRAKDDITLGNSINKVSAILSLTVIDVILELPYNANFDDMLKYNYRPRLVR